MNKINYRYGCNYQEHTKGGKVLDENCATFTVFNNTVQILMNYCLVNIHQT